MEWTHPVGEHDPVLQLSFIPALHLLPIVLCKFQLRHLEPYSPNAVKKRKDISDGVMEGWSIESSVSSPNPITPVFQYSLTPTFGSGSAGLG